MHHLPCRIGERVGHGDQIAPGNAPDGRQLDVGGQFVAGNDGSVLLEDLLGLYVGLVPYDDRFEQIPVGRHCRDGGERQWRNESRVAEPMRGSLVAVCGMVVLYRTRVLAHLLATDLIGLVDLVVMAEPVGNRWGVCGRGHEMTPIGRLTASDNPDRGWKSTIGRVARRSG